MSEPAVVIVSFNTRDPLRTAVAAALREGAPQVIVVDNASTDGSVAMLHAEFPGVVVHANTVNHGYGAAANQGLASCRTPYAVLLNGDACLAPGGLAALRTALDRHPDAAIVGPRLLNADGSLQPSCYAFPGSVRWLGDNDVLAPLHRWLPVVRDRLLRTWGHDREREVPWIKGAAMAIRRAPFESVGGFDESFPLFYEETDLCHRLRLAGWRTVFSPATSVQHVGGASTGDRVAEVSLQLFAGQVQFFQRYSPRLHALWTIALKALQVPAQLIDHARMRLTRDGTVHATLARRISERRRKLRLDPRHPDAAWRAAIGAGVPAGSASSS